MGLCQRGRNPLILLEPRTGLPRASPVKPREPKLPQNFTFKRPALATPKQARAYLNVGVKPEASVFDWLIMGVEVGQIVKLTRVALSIMPLKLLI